jgi:HAD superfamily hydrolase (TIGR01490 family)
MMLSGESAKTRESACFSDLQPFGPSAFGPSALPAAARKRAIAPYPSGVTGPSAPPEVPPAVATFALGQSGRTAHPAAFFDLDKTIIAKSSTLAFSRSFYQGGLINRRAVLRSGYAQFVYLLGGADHDQMERMREYLSALCTGWDVQSVKDIVAETLHSIVEPIIYDEAATLIEEHHAAGRDVVIVSSSGAEVVEPIGEMLGADHVLATRMVVAEGRYTGEIAQYVYGPGKAEAIRELAAAESYDLAESYAYSDSITDLPMLETVGYPHAVNPDRGLRKAAAERGWPVLEFSRPVALRQRLPGLRVPAGPVLAATAVSAGAAAAGLVWYAARRRARAESGT